MNTNASSLEPTRSDAVAPPPVPPVPPVPPAAGPGWYESSWDLRCGLDVQEVALDPSYAAGGIEPEPPRAT